MKTVYSVCGMCGTRCPVAVGVENGEAVWIQGNPHSATGSTLCPRGIAALALEKDSERPQSPLMRVGARGGHKWRAVRWEEALDAVAGKLRAIRDQYGPESVMFSHRGGPFTDLYKAFARGLGTPNIYSHSVTCTRNVDQACASVLGLDRGRLVIGQRLQGDGHGRPRHRQRRQSGHLFLRPPRHRLRHEPCGAARADFGKAL